VTQFLVETIPVSVIVNSRVVSIQPSANDLAGVNNNSEKTTAIRVVIFAFARTPGLLLRRIFSLIMFSGVKPSRGRPMPSAPPSQPKTCHVTREFSHKPSNDIRRRRRDD